MKIKLNQNLRGLKVGKEININDVDGVPTDAFWRARLKDAERDNCITVVKKKTKSKAKIVESKEDSVNA